MEIDKEPWMRELCIDTLPNIELEILAENCGLDFVKELMVNGTGNYIQIPANPFRKTKEQYILKNYDGTSKSIIKMAVECDVSVIYIRKLLKRKGLYKRDQRG